MTHTSYNSQPVSGSQPARSRTIQLYAKDFTSVEQAKPLSLGYGIIRSAGVAITPIWTFSSAEQRSSGGGK